MSTKTYWVVRHLGTDFGERHASREAALRENHPALTTP
jgi:hypothetical protein